MTQQRPEDNMGHEMLTLTQIMTSPIVSVPPQALIEEALEIMMQQRISGLPVVDRDGQLVGILSEFDTLALLLEEDGDYTPIAPVAQFMTTHVQTVEVDTPLKEVVSIFRSMPIRRLPVMRDGNLVGMITRRDLACAIRDERRRRSDLAQQNGSDRDQWIYMP